MIIKVKTAQKRATALPHFQGMPLLQAMAQEQVKSICEPETLQSQFIPYVLPEDTKGRD